MILRRLAKISVVLGIAVLAGGGSTGRAEEATPRVYKLGAYFVTLADFEIKSGTFFAEFWLWSHTPPDQAAWLETVHFPGSVQTTSNFLTKHEKHGQIWACKKVAGTFRETWDIMNYPFDRHELKIFIEETDSDASAVRFEMDAENSQALEASLPPGWRITGFTADTRLQKYNTNFGDPDLPGAASSEYAWATMKIMLERTSTFAIFGKHIAIPFIASLLALLSFFIPSGMIQMMAKFSLLVGSIFAVTFSMLSNSAALGAENTFTLIDQVHLAALFLTLFAILVALVGQALKNQEVAESLIDKTSRLTGLASYALYLGANAWLILPPILG